MFEWLEAEMKRIKTRKFHLFDDPVAEELQEAVDSSDFPLPPSYREFVKRFGNANLYRRGRHWLVKVYAGPREAVSVEGEALIHFGRTDTSLAYFKESELIAGQESPVFEWYHSAGIRRTAIGFEEWLKSKCKAARKRFKKPEWEEIERGPLPFSEFERIIIDSRKRFRWRVVGIAQNEDLQFEITNESSLNLAYFSIGIKGTLRPPKSGPLNGGIHLPVSFLNPGETKIIEFDCYKKYVQPTDIVAFDLPDPEPEDRENYWEFRTEL
ncbi:hypothetical protein KIH39_26190 [Telmatocola sphagniphila]|uniref:Knr4/Smi1-like domain-containing protein n=1 Tax=Telmatocola sphagniphila TaxID=1123043 RepID=A0A8E6B532_9BACT|nr:hypothetical protein [Telmatocola sphagniphila]QVL32280.1 hypothetical protein KIH39_26190 [Telmatocola sphagniphila]